MIPLYFTRAQLFVPQAGEYSEALSVSQYVRTGEWQSLEIPLPSGIVPDGPLRFDPADAQGIIEISELQIVHHGLPEPVWSASSLSAAFSIRGTAIPLATDGPVSILSYGHDPIVVLPVVECVPAGSVLRVRMSADIGERALLAFLRSAVPAALSAAASPDARELLTLALTRPQQAAQVIDDLHAGRKVQRLSQLEIAALREQLRQTVAERDAARLECARSGERENLLRAELEEARLAHRQRHGLVLQLEHDLESTRFDSQSAVERQLSRVFQLERDLESSRDDCMEARNQLARAEEERDRLHACLRAVWASWSWRITAPLRSVRSYLGRR